jgi:hypothetical protein
MKRALVSLGLALSAASLQGQSIFDVGVRLGPQFVQYKLGTPSNTTITELSIPLFVSIPVRDALTIDVGSAFLRARVEQTSSGPKKTSEISGPTDTQIRANYSIGTDFVVVTAGVNVPTGSATVTAQEQLAAGLIGSDFLGFPISNMGTGFGGTAGIAVARPLGEWSLGFGASMRHSASYEPFEATGAATLHYQPGDEYRGRIGLDHPFGTGRFTVGLTYSKFGNDDLAGSVYNTGDRYLTQAALSNTVGRGDLVLSMWNLFRTSGTLADSSYLGRENVSNVVVGYGMQFGETRVEPTAELRSWMQSGTPTSLIANVGVRLNFLLGGLAVSPSAGYSIGRIASEGTTGGSTTASVSGLRAMLAVRVR